jgi:hypothetical protein
MSDSASIFMRAGGMKAAIYCKTFQCSHCDIMHATVSLSLNPKIGQVNDMLDAEPRSGQAAL